MNFEWELEEETESVNPKSYSNKPEPPQRQWGKWLAGLVFVAVLSGMAWWRINRFDRETLRFLQAAVDL